jgi:NAD+--dinitrogen-reductase ADP-D-ribosyltransferase
MCIRDRGWVESRMGLAPTFHNVRIGGIHDEEYLRYAIDRTKGSARTSAINSQLDLLYEYCQYELAKRYPDRKHLTLYRGTFERSEHDVLEVLSKREELVRLNNLNSFTTDEERAWEFGYIVWEVQVPLAKIFFFSELLPNSILKGEGECLIIGGEYRVKRLLCTV